MVGWWQVWPIPDSCCLLQDEQVATAYLPMQLGKPPPPTTLPFSEIFGFMSGPAFTPVHTTAKNIPLSPLAPVCLSNFLP